MFKAYGVPAQQQLSEQVPIPRLAGDYQEVTEKTTNRGGPQPLRQSALHKAEPRAEKYYMRNSVDGGIGEQRRRQSLAKDGLSTDVAGGRE